MPGVGFLARRLRFFFNRNWRYVMLVHWQAPRLYRWLNALKNQIYGRSIRVDASSVCQLKCPACSTAGGMNRTGIVGWGHLAAADFRRLLEENRGLRSVELSNWGEIFLNPELDEIMACAFEKDVRLRAANGVNFNSVRAHTLENLVRYRFHYLSISLDGASQETYSRYRIGGDFERVLDNIRRLNALKQAADTKYPRLAWQFIIFGHNQHELPRAREMAAQLGMRFRPKLNHTPRLFPVTDPEFVARESGLGVSSRTEYKQRKRSEYSFPCGQLWDNPQINWDGKMLGCCVNKFGDFGNVFSDGLQTVLRGEKMCYAQLMVTGKVPPRKDIPCYRCKIYWKLFAAFSRRPHWEGPLPEKKHKHGTEGKQKKKLVAQGLD